jgi:RimJ/RimL family protein N-acetyltransferase
MSNKIELRTDRLILRAIDKKDAKAIFKYRSDEITNQYQGWIPKKLEDVYDFINKTANEINVVNTWFQLVIISKETEELIGDIGIHFLDIENKQVEIGCSLEKGQQGKGYAIEALNQVMEFLFNQLDKHRIIASIDPNNIPSVRLMERLGFRKEAHFKESISINGQWVDDIVYAILKKEWK